MAKYTKVVDTSLKLFHQLSEKQNTLCANLFLIFQENQFSGYVTKFAEKSFC